MILNQVFNQINRPIKMNTEKTTSILSIMVVGSFLLTSTIITIFPLLVGRPATDFIEHLKVFGGLFSGMVGIILGYYFGQKKG